MKSPAAKNNNQSGALGFEATLWATADKLRGNLDQQNLGGMIDLVSTIGLSDNESRSRLIYKYLFRESACAEAKKDGHAR